MATMHQALKLIKNNHYHHLKPHQKHFINQMLEGLSGLGEVSDHDIEDYLTRPQEKFVWVLAKRFRIYIQKTLFSTKKIYQKPTVPYKIIREPSPQEKVTFKIEWQENQFFVKTGLGAEFDSLATVDNLAMYRPLPPYDSKFHNRPLLTIYGMVSKAGWPSGKAYLEMVSTSSKHSQERARISAFLTAMERIDLTAESPFPKPKRLPSKQRKKGLNDILASLQAATDEKKSRLTYEPVPYQKPLSWLI